MTPRRRIICSPCRLRESESEAARSRAVSGTHGADSCPRTDTDMLADTCWYPYRTRRLMGDGTFIRCLPPPMQGAFMLCVLRIPRGLVDAPEDCGPPGYRHTFTLVGSQVPRGLAATHAGSASRAALGGGRDVRAATGAQHEVRRVPCLGHKRCDGSAHQLCS